MLIAPPSCVSNTAKYPLKGKSSLGTDHYPNPGPKPLSPSRTTAFLSHSAPSEVFMSILLVVCFIYQTVFKCLLMLAFHGVAEGRTRLTLLSYIGEGNGNPLQCSCLENPRDGGAWWAAVYGVAQSRTRLKWLSSSFSARYWEYINQLGIYFLLIFESVLNRSWFLPFWFLSWLSWKFPFLSNCSQPVSLTGTWAITTSLMMNAVFLFL